MRQRISAAVDRVVGSSGVEPATVKVPLQITALFWVIKIVSTALGEALADWLDGSPNLVIAGAGVVVAAVVFVWALRRQFATNRYETATYWFAVAMVATFGTMGADSLHQFLGVSYSYTTAFYAVILALVFWRWQVNEGTLSIHSITSRRREKFYWGTVLATFALGTATGDWTATILHLGFLSSGLLFAGLIVAPLLAFRLGGNAVATFWIAYVLTRPLGASFADWFSFPRRLSGLGVGTWPVWLTLGAAMIGLVLLLARIERRQTSLVEEAELDRVLADGRDSGDRSFGHR
jgi:uncharacterized membrane-anchored protein